MCCSICKEQGMEAVRMIIKYEKADILKLSILWPFYHLSNTFQLILFLFLLVKIDFYSGDNNIFIHDISYFLLHKSMFLSLDFFISSFLDSNRIELLIRMKEKNEEDSDENAYLIFKVKFVWIIIGLVLILYQEKKE